MTTAQVKAIACEWIAKNNSTIPGFFGAFFAGSINWANDDANWPSTSDVDVYVIVEDPASANVHQQKFLYDDVLLEVSFLPRDRFQHAEQILGDYPIACHFSVPSIIVDPTGLLSELQIEVARHYAEKTWIRKRIQAVLDWVSPRIVDMASLTPEFERPFNLFYTITMPAQIVLLGNLLNPTFRKVFMLSHHLLASIQRLPLHEKMLTVLGSVAMENDDVEWLLTECVSAFDYATKIIRTPFFGDFNVHELARPLAIDGSRELIAMGFPRESALWILLIRVLCQKAIEHDAPDDQKIRFSLDYTKFLARFGLSDLNDYKRRAALAQEMLAEVVDAAEVIMDMNPYVIDTDSSTMQYERDGKYIN